MVKSVKVASPNENTNTISIPLGQTVTLATLENTNLVVAEIQISSGGGSTAGVGAAAGSVTSGTQTVLQAVRATPVATATVTQSTQPSAGSGGNNNNTSGGGGGGRDITSSSSSSSSAAALSSTGGGSSTSTSGVMTGNVAFMCFIRLFVCCCAL